MPQSPLQGSSVHEAFEHHFARPPSVLARAPGRVNLIGEHTDYNEGFVLPMALEQNTWVAVAPRRDDRLRVVAMNMAGACAEWPRDAWQRETLPTWTAYIAGVAVHLQRRGAVVPGVDVLIASDVPVGGGLSSSAALEVATALALGALAEAIPEGTDLADLARAVEHEFAGVPCGIMDQYVSVLAQADHAFLLDCRSRTWEHIPLRLGSAVVLVINSGVRHSLAAGEYALRQTQCRAAVSYFQRLDPKIRALRDVSVGLVPAHVEALPPEVFRRARHVTTEDVRTQAAARALQAGDLITLGRLMVASHESLRDDYEVSCDELDRLVAIARAVPGVYGARLTGGGFGGCIVVIAEEAALPAIESAVRTQYDAAGFGPAHLTPTRPGPGAALVHCD
ncbi:MAG: galactokinase [Phycisphaerales bacterium]|nr:galactokinase [Phycisphaerales bacterium]